MTTGSVIDALGRRYRDLEKIGEGAMGEVWRGTDPTLERDVAIKLMRPELAAQPEALERFRAEAVSLARLNHPNIVRLYDFVQDGPHAWMVLEYVRGQALDRVLAERGRVPWREACGWAAQALAGLARAHAAGVVHRDIKPANVMLAHDGTIELMDFGIARMSQSVRLTRVGHVVGTVAYMAPEQLTGHEADERSDLYAVGVVMFELLTGKLPFAGSTDVQIIRQHVAMTAAPDVRALARDVPAGVAILVAKALSRDPSKRFADAAAFRQALDDALRVAGVGDGSPAPTRGPLRRALILGVTACVLVGVGAMTWHLRRGATTMAGTAATATRPSVAASATAAPEPATVGGASATNAAPAASAAADQAAREAAIRGAAAAAEEAAAAAAARTAAAIEQAQQACATRVATGRAFLGAGRYDEALRAASEALVAYSECHEAGELIATAKASIARARAAQVPPPSPAPQERVARTQPPPRPHRYEPAVPPKPASQLPAPAPQVASDRATDQARLRCVEAVSNGWAALRNGQHEEGARLAREAMGYGGCEGDQRLLDNATRAQRP